MITVLRNTLKDGGMMTIVWIAVASMIIGSALPLMMKKSSGSWALKVNGTEIPYTTYAAELAMARDYINMLRAQYGQFADYLLQSMGIHDPQSMTVQQLISSQLMVDGYTKQGVYISPQSIAYKMSEKGFIDQHCSDLLPAFLYKDDSLDNNMLKVYLQRRNMTVEQLEGRLKERIGSVFMQQALQKLAYVPKVSIVNSLRKDTVTKDILLIRFSLDSFKKNSTLDTLSNESLKNFYTQENVRTRRYYAPEKRSGYMIQFKPDTYGVTIDDSAVEQYYNDQKVSRYTEEQSKVQVRAIAFSTKEEADLAHEQLINSRKKITEYVEEYPFDDQSLKNNGLLAPIVRGVGDRVLEKAAFVLTHDGDISPVLSHINRFVILERVQKTAPVIKPLTKVRNEIIQSLKTMRFNEMCSRDLRELIASPLEENIALFTMKHNGIRHSVVSLAQTEAKRDSERAFFEAGLNTYEIVPQGADCYLIHVDTINPSTLQPFESIEAQVRSDFIAHGAIIALEKAMIEFLRTSSHNKPQELARNLGYSFNTYTGIKATDSSKVASLQKEGLGIDTLNKLEKAGTYAVVNDGDDKLLVFVENISFDDENATGSAQNTVETGLIKQESDIINAAYIASLYRDAKIEKNDILALLDEENTI
jgi:SurA N-terminal domain